MNKITLSMFRYPLLGLAVSAFCLGSGQLSAQPYINGNLSTGTTTKSGMTAPTGYTWSEVQNIPGETVSNTTTGVGAQIVDLGGNRVADDFTVPAGQTWTLTKVTFYAYQTNYAGALSPFTDVRVRILNGIPSNGASTVVFGDLSTNRLFASDEAMMYRVPNTTTPAPGTAPGLLRKIYKIEATVNAVLTPGTYWIEWQQFAGALSNFSPPSTVVDQRTQPGYNALQFIGADNVYNPIIDTANPATGDDVPLDMPFRIDYTLQTMGLENNALAAKISLFPNPTKGVLNITSETTLDSAEIYDVAGRLVSATNFNGLSTNVINVNSLNAGNYIVKLRSGEAVASKKFVKQ